MLLRFLIMSLLGAFWPLEERLRISNNPDCRIYVLNEIIELKSIGEVESFI